MKMLIILNICIILEGSYFRILVKWCCDVKCKIYNMVISRFKIYNIIIERYYIYVFIVL